VSLIFSDVFMSGKSYAAREMCFATLSDRVKCSCLVGGDYLTMAGTDARRTCHNYNPLNVSLLLENFRDKAINLSEARVLLDRHKSGGLLSFDDGGYLCTTLVDIGEGDPDVKVLAFDVNGSLVTDFEDAKYYLSFSDECELEGNSMKGFYRFFFDVTVLLNKGTIDMDGLPYVRIIESAVEYPEYAAYPMYNASPFGENLTGLVAETVKRNLASKIAKEGLRDFVETGFAKQSNETKYLATALSALQLNTRVSQLLPTPFASARRDDTVFVPTKSGKIEERHVRLASIIFRFNRCIIDSISSLPQTLAGNALSGGTSGGLLRLLQSNQEACSILFYVNTQIVGKGKLTSGDEDPLGRIKGLGGYVDGYVLTESVTDDPKEFLSQKRWYVTTRNRAAETVQQGPVARTIPFLIWDPVSQTTFGLKCYRQGDKIISYKSKSSRYRGPFDPRLVASNDTKLENHFPGDSQIINKEDLNRKRGQTRTQRIPLAGRIN
jgi:hypothetical protein